MPKPSGKPISIIQGLEIYVTQSPSKTKRGKDRVWISVRQANPKKMESGRIALLCKRF